MLKIKYVYHSITPSCGRFFHRITAMRLSFRELSFNSWMVPFFLFQAQDEALEQAQKAMNDLNDEKKVKDTVVTLVNAQSQGQARNS